MRSTRPPLCRLLKVPFPFSRDTDDEGIRVRVDSGLRRQLVPNTRRLPGRGPSVIVGRGWGGVVLGPSPGLGR